MATRTRNRRASFFRHRARQLVDQAKKVRDECDRRHLIELADTLNRAADQMAPRTINTFSMRDLLP